MDPLKIVPGGVSGLNTTYYRVPVFAAGAKVHVTTQSGSIKVLVAIGYPPTDGRLQFGDDSNAEIKTIFVDTDVPDAASVMDLQLYIGVQGTVADQPADFTVWFEPAPDEGPLPGIKPWAGIIVIVLLVLTCVIVISFAVFVYVKKRDRLSGSGSAGSAGGKGKKVKPSKIEDYADGTAMIPLNDDSGGMRDARSEVHKAAGGSLNTRTATSTTFSGGSIGIDHRASHQTAYSAGGSVNGMGLATGNTFYPQQQQQQQQQQPEMIDLYAGAYGGGGGGGAGVYGDGGAAMIDLNATAYQATNGAYFPQGDTAISLDEEMKPLF